MAYMQTLAGAGRVDDAEKLGYEMVARNPGAIAVYDVLYLLYIRQNKVAEAEKILRLKVEKNPKVAQAHLDLASFYFGTKNRPQMTEALKPLQSNAADFPAAPLLVGDFYARIRDYDVAEQQYQLGIQKSPKDKHSYQKRIIELYLVQNKKNEASDLVAQILKEDPKDNEAIAIRASLSLQTGTPEQLQSAINDLQTVVSRMPENPVVRFNLGRAYLAKQSRDAARVQFEEAVKLRPDYAQPRLMLAQMMMQNGEWDKAIQMSGDALKYDPTNVSARLIQTRALIGKGDTGRAREELKQTMHAWPDLPEAKLQNAALDLQDRNYKTAEETFRKLHQQSNDPRALMGLVETFLAQSDSASALKLLREELTKNPDKVEYRAVLGNIAANTKDYSTAVAEYQAVLAKQPKNAQIWLQLSNVYRAMGDSANAVIATRKAQDAAPGNVQANLQLAMLYENTGKKSEARPIYEQVLRLDPNQAIALNNLAYMLAENGGDLDQALTMAQKAKQQRPNDEDVSDTLGLVYIRKNLPDSAIAVFRDLTQKNPQRATFHYHLAMALFQKGDKSEAKRECEAALRLSPIR